MSRSWLRPRCSTARRWRSIQAMSARRLPPSNSPRHGSALREALHAARGARRPLCQWGARLSPPRVARRRSFRRSTRASGHRNSPTSPSRLRRTPITPRPPAAAPGPSGCSDVSPPDSRGRSAPPGNERSLTPQPSSSWLHNSLRGAAGLALAVLVADLTSVQHGFWVVFGALAVLRSNALSTGQTVARAIVGTALGFIVGGALVALIGTNTAVLWVLLPIVVLFAGPRTGGDFVPRRPGCLHAHAAGALQPAGAGRMEARAAADRGRRNRRRRQPRGRHPVLAARRHQRCSAERSAAPTSTERLPGRGRRPRRRLL